MNDIDFPSDDDDDKNNCEIPEKASGSNKETNPDDKKKTTEVIRSFELPHETKTIKEDEKVSESKISKSSGNEPKNVSKKEAVPCDPVKRLGDLNKEINEKFEKHGTNEKMLETHISQFEEEDPNDEETKEILEELKQLRENLREMADLKIKIKSLEVELNKPKSLKDILNQVGRNDLLERMNKEKITDVKELENLIIDLKKKLEDKNLNPIIKRKNEEKLSLLQEVKKIFDKESAQIQKLGNQKEDSKLPPKTLREFISSHNQTNFIELLDSQKLQNIDDVKSKISELELAMQDESLNAKLKEKKSQTLKKLKELDEWFTKNNKSATIDKNENESVVDKNKLMENINNLKLEINQILLKYETKEDDLDKTILDWEKEVNDNPEDEENKNIYDELKMAKEKLDLLHNLQSQYSSDSIDSEPIKEVSLTEILNNKGRSDLLEILNKEKIKDQKELQEKIISYKTKAAIAEKNPSLKKICEQKILNLEEINQIAASFGSKVYKNPTIGMIPSNVIPSKEIRKDSKIPSNAIPKDSMIPSNEIPKDSVIPSNEIPKDPVIPSINKKDDILSEKISITDAEKEILIKENEQRKEKELLQQLILIYGNCPDGLNKYLIMIVYLSQLLMEKTKDARRDYFISKIQSLVKNVETRLSIEGELKSHIKQENMKDLINSNNNQDFEQVNKSARCLLKAINPLNIQEIKIYMKKINDAATQIEGKNIILFLGSTGAGKSTTIQYLLGSKMEKCEMKGIPHIAPVSNEHDPNIINDIATSALTTSETRYIFATKVHEERLGLSKSVEDIYFCDTPGFEDTRGSEIDITNGLGIIRALQNTKTVRIVLVLNFMGIGTRGEGIKKLVDLMCNIMPSIGSYLKCVTYLWTKFPNKEAFKGFHAILKDIRKKVTSDSNSTYQDNFINILDHLLDSTEDIRDINWINPLDGNPGAILKRILKTPTISNTKNIFKPFTTADSRMNLAQKLNLLEKSIKSSCLRREPSLAIYGVREMKYLSELRNLNENSGSENTGVQFDSIAKEVIDISESIYLKSRSLCEKFFLEVSWSPEELLSFFNTYRDSLELEYVIDELNFLPYKDNLFKKSDSHLSFFSTLYENFLTKSSALLSKIKDLFCLEDFQLVFNSANIEKPENLDIVYKSLIGFLNKISPDSLHKSIKQITTFLNKEDVYPISSVEVLLKGLNLEELKNLIPLIIKSFSTHYATEELRKLGALLFKNNKLIQSLEEEFKRYESEFEILLKNVISDGILIRDFLQNNLSQINKIPKISAEERIEIFNKLEIKKLKINSLREKFETMSQLNLVEDLNIKTVMTKCLQELYSDLDRNSKFPKLIEVEATEDFNKKRALIEEVMKESKETWSDIFKTINQKGKIIYRHHEFLHVIKKKSSVENNLISLMLRNLIEDGNNFIAIQKFDFACKIGKRADTISNYLLDYKDECGKIKQQIFNNVESSLETKAKTLVELFQSKKSILAQSSLGNDSNLVIDACKLIEIGALRNTFKNLIEYYYEGENKNLDNIFKKFEGSFYEFLTLYDTAICKLISEDKPEMLSKLEIPLKEFHKMKLYVGDFPDQISSSYYETLNKIRVLMQQSANKIAGVLNKSVEKGTMQEVNVGDIIKSIRVLTDARWFESISQRNYGKILIDIEKILYEFIDEQLTKLEETRLDFSNPEEAINLSNTYKKISGLKKIESLLKNQNQQTEEKISMRFKDAEENLRKKFLSIFSFIAKVKQEINWKKITEFIIFLQNCKLDIFKEDDETPELICENLKSYFKKQYECIVTNAGDCFQKIKEYKSERSDDIDNFNAKEINNTVEEGVNSRSWLRERGYELNRNMKELTVLLSNEYDILFNLAEKDREEIYGLMKKFKEYHKSSDIEMRKHIMSNNRYDIKSLLEIWETFALVDEFLDVKFYPYFSDYSKKFMDRVSGDVESFRNLLNEEKYAILADALGEVKLAAAAKDELNIRLLKKIKYHIKEYVEDIISKLKQNLIEIRQRGKLTIEKSTVIVKMLGSLKASKKDLKEYIFEDNIKEIELKAVESLSTAFWNYLEDIEELFKDDHISDADKEGANMENLSGILSDYLNMGYCNSVQQENLILTRKDSQDMQTIKDVDKNKNLNTLEAKINNIKENNKNMLSKLEREYSNLKTISKKSPVELLKRIDTHSPKLNRTLNSIKNSLINQFLNDVEEVKNSRKGLEGKNNELKKLERLLTYFPPEWKENLAVEIKNSYEELKNFYDRLEHEINNSISTDDPEELARILIDNKDYESIQKFYNKIKQYLRKKLEELFTKIKEKEKSLNFSDLEDELMAVYLFFSHFDEIDNLKVDTNRNIKTVIDTVEILRKNYQNSMKSEDFFISDSFNHFETFIVESGKFLTYVKTKVADKTLSPWSEMVDKFTAFFQVVKNKSEQEFIKWDQIYRDSLKNCDPKGIDLSKKYLESLKSFFKTMSKGNLDEFQLKTSEIGKENVATVEIQDVENFSIDAKLENIKIELSKFSFESEQTAHHDKTRKDFFSKLKNNLINAKKLSNLENEGPVAKKIYQNALARITSEKENLIKKIEIILNSNKTNSTQITEKDWKFVNNRICTLEIFYFELKEFEEFSSINTRLEEFSSEIFKLFDINIEKANKFTKDLNKMALELNNLQMIISSFTNEKIKNKLVEKLSKYFKDLEANKKIKKSDITVLAAMLKELEYGPTLIDKIPIFINFQRSLFNEKLQKLDFNYMKAEMKNIPNNVDPENIELIYKRLKEKFKSILNEGLKFLLGNKNEFIQLIKTKASEIISEIKSAEPLKWNERIKEELLIELLAKVMVLWSITNYKTDDGSEGGDTENYFLEPHCGQLIAIILSLSLDTNDNMLSKNLVELKTGEGKSLVLGLLSIIFALLGFDVICVCYSKYLSERDFKSFKNLFDLLDLTNNIFYGTFNMAFEKYINNQGDVRSLVIDFLLKKPIQTNNKSNDRPKVLLVDEVDVFFSPDFFGNTYNPISKLQHPCITTLIKYIWSEYKTSGTQGLKFRDLMGTTEFTNCKNAFPGCENILLEALKSLIIDLKEVDKHSYICEDGKIGYKDQDSVNFNIAYGYKTMFAYFREQEAGKVTSDTLENKICIQINSGCFSYAQMPCKYDLILGITGTLQNLSDLQKDVLKDKFGLSKYSYVPSIFGQNNLNFLCDDTDVKIESDKTQHYMKIVSQINDRLVGKNIGSKRSVLVFFETENTLMDFYKSENFSYYRKPGCSNIMTEIVTNNEKENIVLYATKSGSVTLLTRSFGRGTDFILYDENLNANGGIHVIQTFFSEDFSEEIQIKGRAARQGNNGSFSFVLCLAELEKFGLTPESFKENKGKKAYKLMDEKRKTDIIEKHKNSIDEVKKYEVLNKESEKFLSDILKNKTQDVLDYILKSNKGPSLGEISRSLCLMDATGSMSSLLNKAKLMVSDMFIRVKHTLKEHKIDEESVRIQFVAYRNYSSGLNDILQCSSWESKPENLRSFLDTVKASGGQGDEAIEVGLQYANSIHSNEQPIRQIILIGDAPANSKESIKSKRNESWNNQTGFLAKETYYSDELNMMDKEIKIHTFYLHNFAKTNFEEIAKRTQGNSYYLNVDDQVNGTKNLIDTFTVEILRDADSLNGCGGKLLNYYQNLNKKGYFN